jgi:hypothetical protein
MLTTVNAARTRNGWSRRLRPLTIEGPKDAPPMRLLLPLLLLPAIDAGATPLPLAWRIEAPVAADALRDQHPAVLAAGRVALQLAELRADHPKLALPLPDGLVATVERVGGEARGDADFTWFGQLAGDPEQTVVLTRVGDFATAYLSLDSGIYELTPDVGGSLLLKVDTDRYPACDGAPLPPHAPAHDGGAQGIESPAGGTGSASLMDVLVVVSPASLAQLGGQPQAQAFAQGAVDSANQAFANSQMAARLRLAGVRFTARADSGNSGTDLGWLRGDPEVATWRNETAADMVGMIAEFGNACGTGYLMGNPPGAGFAPNAFQVTARNCAIGNLSYAHEHGHNMGFQHNPENGSGPAFPYAFGHWVDGNFRTVMSYSNPCTSGCTRRPYFSNPAVNFNGAPTGVADQRDNARAGSQTAPIVAAFRTTPTTVFANGFE